VEYKFEERQKFKIKVFDVDDFSEKAPLEKHDFVGELEFMLHEVVTAKNQILRKPLNNKESKKHNNGTIVITADEHQSQTTNEIMDFELRATFKDVGGDDPVFFIFSRFVAPGEFTPVYKSEVKIKDPQAHLHKWNRCRILTSVLCKEEIDREIRVDFYKSQKNGNHKFLGNSTVTLTTFKSQKFNYPILLKSS
jgi:hypothetical protein